MITILIIPLVAPPEYKNPPQVQFVSGDKADIFVFGIIIYRVLYNDWPSGEGNIDFNQIENILTKKSLCDVKDVLRKCWNLNPNNRIGALELQLMLSQPSKKHIPSVDKYCMIQQLKVWLIFFSSFQFVDCFFSSIPVSFTMMIPFQQGQKKQVKALKVALADEQVILPFPPYLHNSNIPF